MKQITSIILLFVAFSCNSKRSTEINSIKSNRDILMSELTEKYNVALSFDTIIIDKMYSIDFENLMKDNFQIIDGFYIKDIYEKDSEKHIKVEPFISFPKFYFDLKISDSIYQIIRESSSSYGLYLEYILVFKTNYVRKIDFVIEGSSNEYAIDLGISEKVSGPFYCTGSVIEFKTFKDEKKLR